MTLRPPEGGGSCFGDCNAESQNYKHKDIHVLTSLNLQWKKDDKSLYGRVQGGTNVNLLIDWQQMLSKPQRRMT